MSLQFGQVKRGQTCLVPEGRVSSMVQKELDSCHDPLFGSVVQRRMSLCVHRVRVRSAIQEKLDFLVWRVTDSIEKRCIAAGISRVDIRTVRYQHTCCVEVAAERSRVQSGLAEVAEPCIGVSTLLEELRYDHIVVCLHSPQERFGRGLRAGIDDLSAWKCDSMLTRSD